MENQLPSYQPQSTLQPVYLQNVHNPNAKGNVSLGATKCLGIFQFILGFLLLVVAVIFLAVENVRKNEETYSYSGTAAVICGVLALIAGILGVQSFKYPTSYCKSAINLGFCIVACTVGAINLGVYAAGISIFNNARCFKEWKYGSYRGIYSRYPHVVGRPCKMELGISAVLLVLSIIEFCVALAASIYSCQFACCGKEGCCRESTKVMMIAQPNQPFVITNRSFGNVASSAYTMQCNLPPPYYTNGRDHQNETGVVTMQSGSDLVFCNDISPPPPYQSTY